MNITERLSKGEVLRLSVAETPEPRRIMDNLIDLKRELRRLRKIEHAAWHVCESSEERNKETLVDTNDLRALSKLLPIEHPPHHE